MRAVARLTLEREGFEVVEAPDGDSGLALFAANPDGFDVALLDLTMPGLTGQETLRRLKAERPSLPVVLMSGWREDDSDTGLQALGAASFIEKPFLPSQLAKAIRAAIG